MLRTHFLFYTALALLAFTGCGEREISASASGRPLVVATTTMIADMVRDIGGEDIEVAALMGPGVDPHLYKATAEDAQKLGTAKVIFYNGLMLEGRMSELLDRLAAQGRAVHAVTSKMPAASLLQSDDGSHHPDPHVWGDAKLWASSIEVVVEGLGAVIPEKKSAFAERGAKLKTDYLALHDWALAESAKIPAERRILITSHDAFNYFGRAYGFQVVGVQGISTVSEAGLADVAKTVDFIKEKGVKAIFVESSVPHATIERIAKDSGAKIGGELFSDALGTPGEKVEINGQSYDCGTYVGMLRSNVSSVVKALK
ncbi:MAG: zinc ABC transporter substrate-binding protein [Verrucomicrobiaceae bacterium]|nr:zinc ABC transporter substrate-binding protein [Verrucomicrobiaceae bacterium]